MNYDNLPQKKKPKPNNALIKLLYKAKFILYFSILFGFVSNLLMLSISIYSLQVLDRVISSGNLNTLLMLSIVVIGCIMAMVSLNAYRSESLRVFSIWLDKEISKEIFIRSIYYSIYNRGSSASTFFRELENIKNFIAGNSFTTIIDAPWAIIFIIMLFILHPIHGFITILGAIILISLAIISERITKTLLNEANDHFNKSMRQMDIVSRNSEVIGAMGMLDNIFGYWSKKNDYGNELKLIANKKSNFLSNLTRFFRFSIQIAVTGFGALLVLKGEITTGAMIAGSILVGRALAPFEAIVASWKNIVTTRKSFEKLNNFLNIKPYSGGQTKLPIPEGKIEAENLSYSIGKDPEKHIIKNISFTILPGDVVAIIGDSAAGKSTIARLITGIIPPTQGKILLDGIEVFKWSRSPLEYSCNQYIGYLPQDIELFNGSIKTNIARMDHNPDDEMVIKAAKMAQVHDLILNMPEGYDTKIGIEGTALSGGQKQRIALARAFYGNPKLLVLDEPNANLDHQGEEALFNAIKTTKEMNITTIIISHRHSILKVVDKIMVVKNGEIIEFGNRETILAKEDIISNE